MVRYSFNTLNHSVVFGLAPNLPEQIAAAAGAGYDHVGLDLSTVLAHERAGLGPAALAGLLAEHRIGCYELVPLWLTADRERFDTMLADLLRVVGALGPRVVYAIAEEPPDARMAAHFRWAATALADLGTASAIEFVAGWGVDTIGKALGLAVAAGDGVGLVMDSWQFFRTLGGWPALRKLPAGRIAFAQLADWLARPLPDVGFEMANRRLLPGRGAFDLARFRDAVLGTGFDGVVSVEVLAEDWRGRAPAAFASAALAATRALWEPPGGSAPAPAAGR